MTGKSSVLYQVKNMVKGNYTKEQREHFLNRESLFNPKFDFIAGNKIEGILLGTFTTFERNGGNICDLVSIYSGDLPVAKTNEIGHGDDSKAIKIGEKIEIPKNSFLYI